MAIRRAALGNTLSGPASLHVGRSQTSHATTVVVALVGTRLARTSHVFLSRRKWNIVLIIAAFYFTVSYTYEIRSATVINPPTPQSWNRTVAARIRSILVTASVVGAPAGEALQLTAAGVELARQLLLPPG